MRYLLAIRDRLTRIIRIYAISGRFYDISFFFCSFLLIRLFSQRVCALSGGGGGGLFPPPTVERGEKEMHD